LVLAGKGVGGGEKQIPVPPGGRPRRGRAAAEKRDDSKRWSGFFGLAGGGRVGFRDRGGGGLSWAGAKTRGARGFTASKKQNRSGNGQGGRPSPKPPAMGGEPPGGRGARWGGGGGGRFGGGAGAQKTPVLRTRGGRPSGRFRLAFGSFPGGSGGKNTPGGGAWGGAPGGGGGWAGAGPAPGLGKKRWLGPPETGTGAPGLLVEVSGGAGKGGGATLAGFQGKNPSAPQPGRVAKRLGNPPLHLKQKGLLGILVGSGVEKKHVRGKVMAADRKGGLSVRARGAGGGPGGQKTGGFSRCSPRPGIPGKGWGGAKKQKKKENKKKKKKNRVGLALPGFVPPPGGVGGGLGAREGTPQRGGGRAWGRGFWGGGEPLWARGNVLFSGLWDKVIRGSWGGGGPGGRGGGEKGPPFLGPFFSESCRGGGGPNPRGWGVPLFFFSALHRGGGGAGSGGFVLGGFFGAEATKGGRDKGGNESSVCT